MADRGAAAVGSRARRGPRAAPAPAAGRASHSELGASPSALSVEGASGKTMSMKTRVKSEDGKIGKRKVPPAGLIKMNVKTMRILS